MLSSVKVFTLNFARYLPVTIAFLLTYSTEVWGGLGEIVYAVNCGGEGHIDIHGIHYSRDPLHNKIGIASDFGKQLLIGRVPPSDQILYQTERYHHDTFGYDIPIKKDGHYVLVMKFAEVYFRAPNQKVFDIVLNNEVTIVNELDIFERVGRAVGHDEHVEFRVQGNKLHIGSTVIDFNGRLRLDFMKGDRDNPKINAIYIMAGTADDVPQLPPLRGDEDTFGDYEEEPISQEGDEVSYQKRSQPPSDQPKSQKRRPSGPKSMDPYASDESSLMLPVFIAVGAFIPVLFCLCRL